MRVGPGRFVEELYREQGARLWRAVLAYTGDREVSNDTVVEAFAELLRRERPLRRPVPVIWRAAFRFSTGEMAGRARFAGPGPPEGVEAVLDEGGLHDPSGLLLMGLRRVAPTQRGPLVLRYYAGYSMRAAARILGSSYIAMPVRLFRGQRKLRGLLNEKSGDLKARFATLERVPAPDLWRGIERAGRL
jgi:DNA-directed RNA polymerase specialized sigma24 family protein